MKWNRVWLVGLALLAFVTFTVLEQIGRSPTLTHEPGLLAQAEPPTTASPSLPASPATPPTVVPGVPSPTASPSAQASPSPTPTATVVPSIPALPTVPLTPAPAVPLAPAAPPLPLGGEYKDPEGRFKVGILQNYKVSPLAGSVLIEALNGSLAYTVLVRPQAQLGLTNGLITDDALAKIAQTAFQQGEGFQPGQTRSIPGGIQLDWAGSLTIAGQTQPMSGVILARPLQGNLGLLLIAATQTGAEQVPGAVSALLNTLQPL